MIFQIFTNFDALAAAFAAGAHAGVGAPKTRRWPEC